MLFNEFSKNKRNLPDKDQLGTIDPYVQIFYNEDASKDEKELGRTATITDQENPDFGDVFEFDFVRAKHQVRLYEIFILRSIRCKTVF